uniref:Uncharacterized protein n=1 Tax=Rhizophora mucronata TaxID=61149 RepID=A0A2P2ND92_RHIMU
MKLLVGVVDEAPLVSLVKVYSRIIINATFT